MARTTYIYLMERITNREFSTIMLGKREIKIGISDKPIERNKTVDRAIEGKIILLEQYKIKSASTFEAALHDKYKSSKFIPKAKSKGGGTTEWVKIYSYQINSIKRHLNKIESTTKKRKTKKDFQQNWMVYLLISSFIISFLIQQLNK